MAKEKLKVLFAADYVGGYEDRARMTGMFNVYETYIKFSSLLKIPIEIPLNEVRAISVESPEDTSRRVTATRLIALGIFAFAVKKKVKESYVVLELKNGQEAIFSIKGVDVFTMRAKLSVVAAEVANS